MLPPKRIDTEPRPTKVKEVPYEESELVDASGQGHGFFDQGAEDEWEDEDDDLPYDQRDGGDAECRQQWDILHDDYTTTYPTD